MPKKTAGDLPNELNPAVVEGSGAFLDSVADARKNAPESGLSADTARGLLKANGLPEVFDAVAEVMPADSLVDVLDAVTRGMDEYRAAHGRAADPSLAWAAMHRLVVDSSPIRDLGIPGVRGVMDSTASNVRHNPISLERAPAILAMMQMMATEAHPIVGYLPASVTSNEARIIIGQHRVGSNFGAYTEGALLSGVNSGAPYFDGERVLDLGAAGGGSYSVTVTSRIGVAVGAGNPALPILRGRTQVLVNGIPVAAEARAGTGTGNQALAGQVVIAGTTHAISGTANSDTGAIAFTAVPDLPAGARVHVQAYIDFERAPDKAPRVNFEATPYSLYAHASRGLSKVTIDASTQFSNEVGLDIRGQLQLALRLQFANERFHLACNKVLEIGRNFAYEWDYDYSTQIGEKDYSQLWLNLKPVLAHASQEMAERTNDHGIDTLFFTGRLAALLKGLPPTLFEPSGITDRPGVYRMGRLFGQYECYYLPRGRTTLTDNVAAGTGQILAAGRATEVARNILLFGDAVPMILVPIATGEDMEQRDGFYHRGFHEINPHEFSNVGAAVINVININS